MKLELDPSICDGFGVCAQMLPELIRLDDWGYPVIGLEPVNTGFERDRRSTEVPADLEHLAHKAVIGCPKLALRLTD